MPEKGGRETCRFCRIVSGDETAFVVLSDERFLAFLDYRPLFPGHLLLIPKAHFATLPELPPQWVEPLFLRARLLARAMEEDLGAEGSFVALNNRVSQSVPHLHVHVVPRRRGDGLKGFFWPRHPYPDLEAARQMQQRLKAFLDSLSRRARLGHLPPLP